MSVFRVKKDGNYTVINNTCLRDPGLSWKAKGLHSYMISMPDDWVFYNSDLEKRAKDGKDSLKSALKELKEAGYLQRIKKKNEKGHFDGWETIVYEMPLPKEENPKDGKPDRRENRPSENPPLLSTNINEVLKEQSTKGNIPFQEIVEYLNERAEKKYKHTSKKTQSLIKARFGEGFTVDDFKEVIDKKTDEWLNDNKMNQYLRPETLFGTKFESYLNHNPVGSTKSEQAATLAETNPDLIYKLTRMDEITYRLEREDDPVIADQLEQEYQELQASLHG